MNRSPAHHNRAGIALPLFWILCIFGCACASQAQDAPSAKLPALYLIGDSTVNNHTKGQVGWGDPIASHFDAKRITVLNKARAGRSSRSYRTEGLWQQVLTDLKPGDFVLMQFGHNDGGGLNNATTWNRASLKGNGDETQEVTNPTTGAKETVHSYGWYLRQYIQEAKEKGARPIVLSPVPRKIWKDDHTVARASGDYGLWASQAAKQEGVEFIDLNDLVAKRYEALGKEKVEALFADEHTHTTAAGAAINAKAVAEGIRTLQDCPLKNYLTAPPTEPPSAKP